MVVVSYLMRFINHKHIHTHTHLLYEVRNEGICLILSHAKVFVFHKHLKQRLEELKTLQVDGRVCLKEPQSHPAKEKVYTTNGSLFVRWRGA